ncbi:terminase large subunit [Cellulophaga phage phi14:2]|uniref:Terminase large subunit n=1 Tax=Cellulophaga phage phi14:2 TaxID=1327990 RepID=S0A426_9CAUD|nr:terminase large subunit [Cellulophaga phage phi14:2]AGO48983.1 hypothetical protein Phi14:2_gp105 [Cellulophaga phage phi14:2]
MEVVRDSTIPIINNRNNFLVKSIPNLHPSSVRYLKYWKQEKKRCIEGFWGIDNGDINCGPLEIEESTVDAEMYRFMPPKLYWYVNYGTIRHRPDHLPKTSPKVKIRPYLRDFEWGYFYNELEARGFSGFELDDENSCNTMLKDPTEFTDEDLRAVCLDLNDEIIQFKYNNYFKKDGSRKTYVNPREYIRRVFDKPMGTIVYENEAKNFMLLGARGGGKSFLTAGTIAHEWLFDGAKYYNEDSIKNPAVVEVLVGAALSSKSSEILGKVRDMIEDMPGAYSEESVHPFYKDHSGSLAPNNFKNPFRHEYEKKVAGKWKRFGSGSKILHATFTIENPEAAAGTRPGLIIIEEVGLMPNLLLVHGSNTAAQMTDGVIKFGSSIYIGTGGNIEKIIESEMVFRDPKGFSMLEFDDIWEGNGKIGWFVPAYYMDGNFKDKNGNTRLKEATEVYEKRRVEKKKAKSNSAIDLEMMNYPLKPSEMFINKLGNRFPIAELKQQLVEVQTKRSEYRDKHWTGTLVFNKLGKLEFKPKDDNLVVRDYPILDNRSKEGMIEIFEMPKRDQQGEVFRNRYYSGTDTYDDDESSTNSLGSIFVMDSWTQRIVAEFTGRPSTTEFYEITRKLTIFYNATNNYENNKKGLFWHYEKKKSLNILAETPRSLKDEANVSIRSVGNTRYGTPVGGSRGVQKYGIQLIESWLDGQATGKEEGISNVYMIRSEGLLKELIAYNPDPSYNFDRIMSLIMTLILTEDQYRMIEQEKDNQSKPKSSALAQDNYFNKNYDGNAAQARFAQIEKRSKKILFPNEVDDSKRY